MEQLLNNKDYIKYLWMNPKWYKLISRNEFLFTEFVDAYKIDTKQTFNDYVDTISQYVSIAKAILDK